MARLIRLRQFKSVTKSLRYFVQRSGMVLTGAAVLVVSALVATPASPARAGSTTVSFTVLSGPLSINTPLPVSRLAAGVGVRPDMLVGVRPHVLVFSVVIMAWVRLRG